MNSVCVEKPSEGILTLLGPREITQERNEMNVKNVGECLFILHPFGPMCELMLARNPMNVFSVGNLLVLTHPLWHMCESTLERKYEFHQCGKVFKSSLSLAILKRIHNWEKLYKCNGCGKTSSGAGTWLCIREWTPGRDYLCDDFPLAGNSIWWHTWEPTVGRSFPIAAIMEKPSIGALTWLLTRGHVQGRFTSAATVGNISSHPSHRKCASTHSGEKP